MAERKNAQKGEEHRSDAVEKLLRRDELVGALRQLPRRQREVLALRYFLDLTEADTAEALRISIGAVKAYASRGLAQLAVSLGGQP